MPTPAGLIFDLDGTLVDTGAINRAALAATLAVYGVHDPGTIGPNTGMAFVDRARQLQEEGVLAPNTSIEDICAECDRQIIARVPQARPIGPVVDVVLAARGRLPLAVATSNTRPVTSALLAGIGLAGMFAAVVTREDVRQGKPAPDCFLRAAELLRIEPERCQVYEDTPGGLTAARAAGMTAIDVRPMIGRSS